MYKLLIKKKASKFLSKLSSKDYLRISTKIHLLENNPRPIGCKKLTDKEGYRLRVGNFRILYAVDDDVKIIAVYNINNRGDIYKT